MPRTAEIKLRIDPELKAEATALYSQWGLNLTDAVTIFLNQSVAAGGLPFSMKRVEKPKFNWNNPNLIQKDKETGRTLLPAEWESDKDSVYDSL